MKSTSSRSYGTIINRLKKTYPEHAFVEVNGSDPYRILISCILSLRTQDSVSLKATKRLFAKARRPKSMLKLSTEEFEKLIYPVGFYRNKTKSIQSINQILIEKYNGTVPNTMDDLLTFPGVGRKTANLVLSLGFAIPAICVDIHVHRICNRLGWCDSKTPEETEFQLMNRVAKRYWIDMNSIFVNHGQNICRPITPKCSRCPISDYCDHAKNLVAKSADS